MYVPTHFAETRVDVLHELVRAHPLGALVVLGADGLDANHIPFEIDPEPAPFGTLRGHVARANPVWRDFSPEVEALAIFEGPHAYISPAWYASKKEHGKVVPTWNYAVVHAHGIARAIEDASWLRAHVEALTNAHETGRQAPWAVGDAPADFIDKLLNAIVGIEISVTRLTGKWKVSQNRSVPDRIGVLEGLERDGAGSNAGMAALIKDTLDQDG